MLFRRQLLVGVLAFVAPFSTNAGEVGEPRVGDLRIPMALMVCVAQNPSLSRTPVGAYFHAQQAKESGDAQQKLDRFKRAAASCLESRQWLPTAFCDELFKVDVSAAKPNFSTVIDKYDPMLAGVKELEKCLSDNEDLPQASE